MAGIGSATAGAGGELRAGKGERRSVEAARRRWLDFREADCAVRAALAAGGSGTDRFALGCRLEMTRARTPSCSP